MTRSDVLKIHGFFDAASIIPSAISVHLLALLFVSGVPIHKACVLSAGIYMLALMWSAVSTDMLARRIPNAISAQMIVASVILWVGMSGDSFLVNPTGGVLNPLLGKILGQSGNGAYFPYLDLELRWHIGVSILTMFGTFGFYYVFYRFFAMGGGDVKLMTGAALFFGWPMTGDFVLLTIVAGGLWSVFVWISKFIFKSGVTFGLSKTVIEKFTLKRHVPYAPGIAVAATLCVIRLFEGML